MFKAGSSLGEVVLIYFFKEMTVKLQEINWILNTVKEGNSLFFPDWPSLDASTAAPKHNALGKWVCRNLCYLSFFGGQNWFQINDYSVGIKPIARSYRRVHCDAIWLTPIVAK